LPIIVISAEHDTQDVVGVSSILAKPFQMEQLFAAIHAALRI
jgi:DNA-binding response OmpR family regulator